MSKVKSSDLSVSETLLHLLQPHLRKACLHFVFEAALESENKKNVSTLEIFL